MRWRITIRSNTTELRGYIDAPLADLERFAAAVKPLGLIVIASPADADYDPFPRASPNDGSVCEHYHGHDGECDKRHLSPNDGSRATP